MKIEDFYVIDCNCKAPDCSSPCWYFHERELYTSKEEAEKISKTLKWSKVLELEDMIDGFIDSYY